LAIELFALHLTLALVIGGLMGLERQWHQRMAGTRTHALVSAGAAAFVMVGPLVQSDPTAQGRIISYVVSGVGFLGAGVIFKEGGQVQGLNTAASIWCAAAVGTLSGIGAWQFAAILAIGVLVINAALRPLAYKLRPGMGAEEHHETGYHFEFVCRQSDQSAMRSLLVQGIDPSPFVLHELNTEDIERSDNVRVKADLRCPGRAEEALEVLVAHLSGEDGVNSIRWRLLPGNTPNGRTARAGGSSH